MEERVSFQGNGRVFVSSTLQAKRYAILRGIKEAHERGFAAICVDSDSSVLMQAIKNHSKRQ